MPTIVHADWQNRTSTRRRSQAESKFALVFAISIMPCLLSLTISIQFPQVSCALALAS